MARRAAVVVISVLLALFVTAGVASAAPANPPTTDGCSTPGANISRVPGVFDFRIPCQNHDYCYEGFDPAGNVAVVSRFTCDNRFLRDMLASCTDPQATTPKNAKRCRDTAYLYYAAVRIFGGRYYDPGYSTRP